MELQLFASRRYHSVTNYLHAPKTRLVLTGLCSDALDPQ
jgi:hypothetical protein